MVYLVTALLKIFSLNVMLKNFENRSIFCKDMDKNLWLTFLAQPVTALLLTLYYTAPWLMALCHPVWQPIAGPFSCQCCLHCSNVLCHQSFIHVSGPNV